VWRGPSRLSSLEISLLRTPLHTVQCRLQAIKLPDQQQRAIRENLLKPEALRQYSHSANGAAG
jgi:hypothetical protein